MYYPKYQKFYAFVATELLCVRVMEHLYLTMGNSECVNSYLFNYH